MDLLERTLFFCIGGGVGFILGYIVARLREIEVKVDHVKEEVHEVDEIVKKERDESGYMRFPIVADVMLFLVIVLTVWAAVQTSRTNTELDRTVTCLTAYNTALGESLTSRDDAIQSGTRAEIDLWTLYDELYEEAQEAREDPKKLIKLQDELNVALVDYRDKLIEVQRARTARPYPPPATAAECEE